VDNPFDRADQPYLALVNDKGQHSLWPFPDQVPAGWTVTHGPDTRAGCLDHVNAHWTDTRPRSLAAWMTTSHQEANHG
jgi:MbtH protein